MRIRAEILLLIQISDNHLKIETDKKIETDGKECYKTP